MSRVLIIKFAAIGDVLRTTPLLPPIARRYSPAEISWVTERQSAPVLDGNPFISRLLIYEALDPAFKKETFNVLINLDKDQRACELAGTIEAEIKKGFGWGRNNEVIALDPDSDYAVRLGKDDELKFKLNQKTYQQISFEQIGLQFSGEEYIFSLTEQEEEQATQQLQALGVRPAAKKIGINTGAGKVFAGKKLPAPSLLHLIEALDRLMDVDILLLGGPDEKERNAEIMRRSKVKIYDTGTGNTIRQFAAIINQCRLVIAGDTVAMHLAIALKKRVIGFFGSTSANEIELYGRGLKIVSDIDCAPCYKRSCPRDELCMQQIDADQIARQAAHLLEQK